MTPDQQKQTRWLRINPQELKKQGVDPRGISHKVDREGTVVQVTPAGLMTHLQMLERLELLGKVCDLWNAKKLRNPWDSYRSR